MFLDDAENHGQAEAGSFTDLFSRKKRFIDARLNFHLNALSIVADAQPDKLARAAPRMVRIRLLGVHVARLQFEASAVGHGVAGVEAKVHQDLIDLAGVRFH